MLTMTSKIDKSVNIFSEGFGCRFVQRSETYAILYLSVQDGCEQLCRFCWLTQNGNIHNVRNADIGRLEDQVYKLEHLVFKAYPLEKLHINFMAKGEPLKVLTIELVQKLYAFIKHKFSAVPEIKFLISSIIPKGTTAHDLEIFRLPYTKLYYSMYDIVNRDALMPNAMPIEEAINLIRQVNIKCTVHGAELNVSKQIADSHPIWYVADKVNIVRFNKHSRENKLQEAAGSMFKGLIPTVPVKHIERVGEDVYASCGMFIGKELCNGS